MPKQTNVSELKLDGIAIVLGPDGKPKKKYIPDGKGGNREEPITEDDLKMIEQINKE